MDQEGKLGSRGTPAFIHAPFAVALSVTLSLHSYRTADSSHSKINKLMSVFHEFRHNVVKVAVDPRRDSPVDPQTTLTML